MNKQTMKTSNQKKNMAENSWHTCVVHRSIQYQCVFFQVTRTKGQVRFFNLLFFLILFLGSWFYCSTQKNTHPSIHFWKQKSMGKKIIWIIQFFLSWKIKTKNSVQSERKRKKKFHTQLICLKEISWVRKIKAKSSPSFDTHHHMLSSLFYSFQLKKRKFQSISFTDTHKW